MNIEEALLILDVALEQKVLNDIQELVFHQSWLGQTYLEMAESSRYNANYIKDVGYKLWKLLSKVFEEEVTKSNFRSVLRRQHVQVSRRDLLTHNVSGEDSGTSTENSVSFASDVSVSQKRSVNDLVLPEALELALEKDIAFVQIGESQQTLVVDIVLATVLNAEDVKLKNINIHRYTSFQKPMPAFVKRSQNIKTKLLTIPQFLKTKETIAQMKV